MLENLHMLRMVPKQTPINSKFTQFLEFSLLGTLIASIIIGNTHTRANYLLYTCWPISMSHMLNREFLLKEELFDAG